MAGTKTHMLMHAFVFGFLLQSGIAEDCESGECNAEWDSQLHRKSGESSSVAPGVKASCQAPIVVVKPGRSHEEGLGSLLHHHRKSLAYALALGLPWIGTLFNVHTGRDEADTLGLCQPCCMNKTFTGFDRIRVDVQIDKCLEPGAYKLPGGLTQRGTIIGIEDDFLDEGHAACLAGIRDRFLAHSPKPVRCQKKQFLAFHFRWGDVGRVRGYTVDSPEARTIPMNMAAKLIQNILKVCPFEIKLLSEGADVYDSFRDRFAGKFKYIDGNRTSMRRALNTFACSSVVIGGRSQFSVLGALLSQTVAIGPSDNLRWEGLNQIMDVLHWTHHLSGPGPDLEQAVQKVAKGRCDPH